MQWIQPYDFQQLLRYHASPYAALRFYKDRRGPVELFTIMDYHRPRRAEMFLTGHAADDWSMASVICNAACGPVPSHDIDGVWREAHTDPDGDYTPPGFVIYPRPSYRTLISTLLREGVIVPSRDLDKLLGVHTSELATNANRMHYIP